MKKINICDDNEHVFSVYLVRYFRFGNNVYFIYTLQEKDNRDYMKLYVVKIMKELGTLVTQTIRNQDEWNQMKVIVKRILSEIKKQRLNCIEDLDSSELENIIIYENRSFRIATDLVYALANEIVNNEYDTSFIEMIPTVEKLKTNETFESLNVDENSQPNGDIESLSLDDTTKAAGSLELQDSDNNITLESEIEVLEL